MEILSGVLVMSMSTSSPRTVAEPPTLVALPGTTPSTGGAVASSGAVALAIEPAEQYRDGPGVVAEAMAGAADHAQLGRPVGLGEEPGVDRGDRVVVVAVNDEQRARREALGRVERPEAAQL